MLFAWDAFHHRWQSISVLKKFRLIEYNRNMQVTSRRLTVRSSTSISSPQGFDPALRGACEKSARSVMSVLRREAPAGTSPEILMDLAASLTGVIERTTVMLLAGKQVRVIEDDEVITTQVAADLLNVSRPHLVKLLDRGDIPPLPKVGRHRRVARASVLKYKRTRDAQRESALKELAALSQHHGLGY